MTWNEIIKGIKANKPNAKKVIIDYHRTLRKDREDTDSMYERGLMETIVLFDVNTPIEDTPTGFKYAYGDVDVTPVKLCDEFDSFRKADGSFDWEGSAVII